MLRKPAIGGVGSNQYASKGVSAHHGSDPAHDLLRAVGQPDVDPEEVAWAFSPEAEQWKRLDVNSNAEARTWQDSQFDWDDTIRWRNAGFDCVQAALWSASGMNPYTATDWVSGGWTLEQVTRLTAAGVVNSHSTAGWLTVASGDRVSALTLIEKGDKTLIGGDKGWDGSPTKADWGRVADRYKTYTRKEMEESGLGVPSIGRALLNDIDIRDLAQRWRNAGFDTGLDGRRWSSYFHDPELAAQWAFHPDIAAAHQRVTHAWSWSQSGFTPSEAVAWADNGLDYAPAHRWRQITADPVRARYLADRVPATSK